VDRLDNIGAGRLCLCATLSDARMHDKEEGIMIKSFELGDKNIGWQKRRTELKE